MIEQALTTPFKNDTVRERKLEDRDLRNFYSPYCKQ